MMDVQVPKLGVVSSFNEKVVIEPSFALFLNSKNKPGFCELTRTRLVQKRVFFPFIR